MSDDLISRRAAIDAMCDNCDTVNADCAHYPCSRYLAVINLPSAQPEQIARDIATILENERDMRVMLKNLEDAPTVDAVPVIRCNECKHLLPNDRIAPNWWRICDYWRTGVDENEYCSRGERKKE